MEIPKGLGLEMACCWYLQPWDMERVEYGSVEDWAYDIGFMTFSRDPLYSGEGEKKSNEQAAQDAIREVRLLEQFVIDMQSDEEAMKLAWQGEGGGETNC